jgi:hypothetical protein
VGATFGHNHVHSIAKKLKNVWTYGKQNGRKKRINIRNGDDRAGVINLGSGFMLGKKPLNLPHVSNFNPM